MWFDRITPKQILGNSPYVLVYGKQAKLPISTELPSLELADNLMLFEEDDPLGLRYAKLLELEEERRNALRKMEYQQIQTKRVFDKKSRLRSFKEGDLVLKWDVLKSKLGHHNKFDHMWAKPFLITECKEHNAFQLATMEGNVLPIPVNGIHLKPCFKV